MRRLLCTSLLVLGLPLLFPAWAQGQARIYHEGWIDLNKNGRKDVYEDPEHTVADRVEDLLAQMTLDEKTMQTVTLYGSGRVLKDAMPTPAWKDELWKDGLANIDEQHNHVESQTEYAFPYSKHARAINETQRWFVEETRLGIPVDFTNEGIRGLAHHKATAFPSQIGQASTWDAPLVSKIAHVTGREARALGYTNIYSPILDVTRDPRWGRTVETYGESPFLVATLGEAAVRGLQAEGVVSTPKHFAVYSVPKGARDGDARTDPHVAPREMHELLLRPFRQAFAAGAMGTMASYNDWNGLPIIGSRFFLTDLLRQEYGFEGYVVSDSRAVEYLHEKHHVAADQKESAAQVMEAGMNVRTDFSPPEMFVLPLREALREGRLSERILDDRVRDVLRVKFRLGLFDHPYVADPDAADHIVRAPDAMEASLNASREALVLLKNENGALPLDRSRLRSVLITGPMATATEYASGRYGANHLDVVSVFEGLRAYLGNGVKVRYEQGVTEKSVGWPESELYEELPPDSVQQRIDRAAEAAREADVVIAVLGGGNGTVGESRSRTSLDLPGYQEQLLQAVHATGTPVVLVLINGRPLTINWAAEHVPAILEAWFPGEQSGRVVAEALFGETNPGGKLPITFPRTVGQIEYNFPFKRGSQADVSRWVGVRTRVSGALFPFGYGLSYTTFEYSNLRITPDRMRGGATVTVAFDVTNTGSRPGDAVPQVYVRDVLASVTTYDSQLRGFSRVPLQPGQTKTVTVELGPDDLWLLDRDMNWAVEKGTFEVMVGQSSQDIVLTGTLEITETVLYGKPPLDF